MSPDEVKLVRESWAKVMSIADSAAGLFYGRLFEIAPQVRPLFRGDMKVQGRKLMNMINTVVLGLDRLDSLQPAIQDLGRRHQSYGVENVHYDFVGTALLWTLEQGLGKEFTSQTRTAWAKAYDGLASAMKAAAQASTQT